ncbi:MAG: hypothetical protein LBQ24_02980 [Candidatus Peribacteria bacterium]|jgi:aspartyl-tRNA(Asn)/glutamyl-tRNA(Gln) amidotransferase subunit C|nr:hypothetical protein [Candidatus Peribacteria bacterium]
MILTQEQIEKLSIKLSKIRPNSGKLEGSINSILEYMNMLNEIDTKNIEPTTSVIKKENTLRKDTQKRNISPNTLLACSNQKVI